MIKYKYFFVVLLLIFLEFGACKSDFNKEEIAELKAKAETAKQQLKTAVDNNQDVSNVVPKMKQVKVLADKHKFKQADELLDEILIDFQKINSPPTGNNNLFTNPRRVNIIGNPYSAMEPFISRDNSILFFNSDKNDVAGSEKNIYYATRVNNITFQFMGAVKGVNSNQVDGVPTMDNHGNFYFVSTARYNKENKFASAYKGKFIDGEVVNIVPIPELSLNEPGWVNMDIEISADGNTIYSTQTFFNLKKNTGPIESYFFKAHLKNGKFEIDENSREIFKNINTEDLEYAASISTDELEIFFTRLIHGNTPTFYSYYAKRSDKDAPFGKPIMLKAITGFSEAPAITNDGQLLYYHKKDNDRFYIYAIERK